MQFRILGPLEVRAGGASLSLGGAKQRALLGFLLVHANEAVSADRLIDALWGEKPPGTAKTALQGYIAGLRRALEPERTKGKPAQVLVTQPAGYLLRVGDGALDARRFEALLAQAEDAPPEGAAGLLGEALELWRGPALADFAYQPWAQAESERLQELRLICQEERIHAQLELGQHTQLVPELEALIAKHPLRERPRGQLMLALYRSGRQAEALDAYQQARAVLVDQLGIDPSPELQQLNKAILNQDDALRIETLRRGDGLPSGTVTFLCTDIEGSTGLLRELGEDAYAAILERHRDAIRGALAAHHGREVDTQGDSFLIAFARAGDAAAAAQHAQAALANERVRVRVRMGIHTGEPIPQSEGYIGLDLHRVARICAAAHGGQILLSQTTRELLDPESLRDLGPHWLKDLAAPEHLYQLGPGDFPTPTSLHRTNLPIAPTPLVGRQRDLAQASELLADIDVRLLTLTGPGGIGKTRLALALAQNALPEYPDGVCYCDLSPAREPPLALASITQALQISESDSRTPIHRLRDALRDRQLLLLLDNLEQILDVAPSLAELLAACPQLRILATSRAPLHLAAEHEYPVRPLAEADAVELFKQRAQAVRPDFAANDEVEEICDRLDRLPLAIELAAARARVLTASALLERLEQRLPLLTGGPRDAPERQRTVRATLDWSYNLLEDEEQRLFARLGVFAGSFTLEAAEQICDANLDTLEALVDRSLLRSESSRFTLLETIREYALERLEESAESEELRRRHADWMVELARAAEVGHHGPQQQEWTERVEAEHANVVTAIEWLLETDPAGAVRLAAAAALVAWEPRGRISEGRRLLDRALSRAKSLDDASRAVALYAAGRLAWIQDDRAIERSAFSECAELAARSGDLALSAMAQAELVWNALAEDALDEAKMLALAASKAANTSGQPIPRSLALLAEAGVAESLEEYDAAWSLYSEGLGLSQDIGNPDQVANWNASLAWLALLIEDYDVAATHHQLALSSTRSDLLMIVHGNMGLAALVTGDLETAQADLNHSLRLSHRLRSARAGAESLIGLAGIAAARSETNRALVLWGAAQSLHETVGSGLNPVECRVVERYLEPLAALDTEAEAAALARGRAMSFDEAVAFALGEQAATEVAR